MISMPFVEKFLLSGREIIILSIPLEKLKKNVFPRIMENF
jgi:hypothetical protein